MWVRARRDVQYDGQTYQEGDVFQARIIDALRLNVRRFTARTKAPKAAASAHQAVPAPVAEVTPVVAADVSEPVVDHEPDLAPASEEPVPEDTPSEDEAPAPRRRRYQRRDLVAED
jgi:hypothetical protein